MISYVWSSRSTRHGASGGISNAERLKSEGCDRRACEKLPALPKALPAPGSLPVANRAPAVAGSLPCAAALKIVRSLHPPPRRPNPSEQRTGSGSACLQHCMQCYAGSLLGMLRVSLAGGSGLSSAVPLALWL